MLGTLDPPLEGRGLPQRAERDLDVFMLLPRQGNSERWIQKPENKHKSEHSREVVMFCFILGNCRAVPVTARCLKYRDWVLLRGMLR